MELSKRLESLSSGIAALVEKSNSCHNKSDGKFCSTGGGKGKGSSSTPRKPRAKQPELKHSTWEKKGDDWDIKTKSGEKVAVATRNVWTSQIIVYGNSTQETDKTRFGGQFGKFKTVAEAKLHMDRRIAAGDRFTDDHN